LSVCQRVAFAVRHREKAARTPFFHQFPRQNRRNTMSTDLTRANTNLTTVPAGDAAEMPATQITALGALLSGKTAGDAAAAAGISRSTLYNWLGKDYRFQAALNRGRRDMRQAVACRAEQLASDAAECVAGAVREGDVKAALEIVKRANIFAASKIGSDDETVLRYEDEKRRVDREAELAFARRCRKAQVSQDR